MKEDNKLGLLPLTMLVIGSLIGCGIFDLMQNMSKGAGLIPMLIAWGITAVGMGTFVLCFQNLSQKRPDLTAGIYSYAKEGFNDAEQIRLRDFCDKISKDKALFVASNSDPKNVNPSENFFDNLYNHFIIKRVSAARMINSDASGRGAISELMISNVVNA